jgi:hypothetical protein
MLALVRLLRLLVLALLAHGMATPAVHAKTSRASVSASASSSSSGHGTGKVHVSSSGGGSASGSATISSGGRKKTARAHVEGDGEASDEVEFGTEPMIDSIRGRDGRGSKEQDTQGEL